MYNSSTMRKLLVINFRRFYRNSSSQSLKPPDSAKSDKGTIDHNDVNHHAKLRDIWWDLSGKLSPLHSFNPLRIQLIREGLRNAGHEESNAAEPLKGLKILDVGCGGGILSEPIARIGANVTGLDASEELISIAKEHAKLDPSLSDRLNYVNIPIEDYVKTNSATYDAIVASEILEHVTDRGLFLRSCSDILKPGGSIFITTINKTFASWLGGIVIAEYLINLIPRGTHQWDKFVTPEETQRLLDDCGCKTRLVHGIMYNPVTNKWSWVSSTAINYAIHAVKSTEST